MEADISAMQSDLDDAMNAQRAAEERADRLQAEVNRLADELRQEQENYKNAESLRKQLEIEIREITVRLEEAEAFAQREGKRQIAKLQARVSRPASTLKTNYLFTVSGVFLAIRLRLILNLVHFKTYQSVCSR